MTRPTPRAAQGAIRSPDPVVFLENELVYGRSFDVPVLDDHRAADRQGAHRARGQGRDDRELFDRRRHRAAGGGDAGGEGIDAEVIDLRTLRPLDTGTVLASLKKTNRLVVVEEGWPVCSIASEIMAMCMEQGFDDLDAPVLRVTNEDVPLPYAANLEKAGADRRGARRRGGEEGVLQGLSRLRCGRLPAPPCIRSS
jgi:pyruvate dehydrogenase E1 component beta subunit